LTKGLLTTKKPKRPFHNKKVKEKRGLDSYGNSENLDLVNTNSVSSEVSLIYVREIYKEMNKK